MEVRDADVRVHGVLGERPTELLNGYWRVTLGRRGQIDNRDTDNRRTTVGRWAFTKWNIVVQ